MGSEAGRARGQEGEEESGGGGGPEAGDLAASFMGDGGSIRTTAAEPGPGSGGVRME